jgi:hypothetical protein
MHEDFELSIDMGNDAMQYPGDVARALREVADAIDNGAADGRIRDENGNTVGAWDFS